MTQTDISREAVERLAQFLVENDVWSQSANDMHWQSVLALRAQSQRIADLEAQLTTIATKAAKAMQEEASLIATQVSAELRASPVRDKMLGMCGANQVWHQLCAINVDTIVGKVTHD